MDYYRFLCFMKIIRHFVTPRVNFSLLWSIEFLDLLSNDHIDNCFRIFILAAVSKSKLGEMLIILIIFIFQSIFNRKK